MIMTPDEIRSGFLSYFERLDHRIVESSPVVPQGDPTLLFTNAGMNQFKDLLLGNEFRDYKRAASVQKCIRAGGKHNDLEDVGKDGRHLTCFEMLGNWSFGDYYKRESIRWGWDYVLNELKFDLSRVYVTVFRDDDESFNIWRDEIGVPAERILRLGEKENFWAMGPVGPCGPCTEIHYDLHPELGELEWVEGYDDNRVVEFWNHVFMEFNRSEDGVLNPLPMKSVDTGMGLDRVAMIMAGRDNVFQTNLFSPILNKTLSLLGREGEDLEALYKSSTFESFAVIADHIRTLTFALCDGAKFSNEGRGSVLRSILRRAVRHGRQYLGFEAPFMFEVAQSVIDNYKHVYPELTTGGQQTRELIKLEEERFFRTIDRGLSLFNDVVSKTREAGSAQIAGAEVFELHATYGFPPDLTRVMAEEQGFSLDTADYERRWVEHQEISRGKDMYEGVAGVGDWVTLHEGQAGTFIGYDTLVATTKVRRFRAIGEDGEVEVLLATTPFYAESGGQAGDSGTLTAGALVIEVSDTQKAPIGIIHKGRVVSGSLDALSGEVVAQVNPRQRKLSMSNHTATHLLHAALRGLVSDGIFQAGSLVNAEKLRFDFSYGGPIDDERLYAVESEVNRVIREGHEVIIHKDVPRDEAVSELGAMAIFGEKYGDHVRVVQIPGESVELCGGTHVRNTRDIGLFRITSEAGVAAGIRRIEAVTDAGALALYEQDRSRVQDLARVLKSDPTHVIERARALLDERAELDRQVQRLSQRLAMLEAGELVANAAVVGGVKIIAQRLKVDTAEQLMAYADQLREKLDEGAVLLGAELDGKVSLVCVVTDAAFKARKIKAGDLINAVAVHVDGKGGGRPTLAKAGGSNVAGLDAALGAFEGAITQALGL
jgi:alanyl-tRNA synthetase